MAGHSVFLGSRWQIDDTPEELTMSVPGTWVLPAFAKATAGPP
jgi:hypothetical protein